VSGAVRIGCSGWNYKHWREIVYSRGLPPRRWLEHYAQRFDTVELNTTFYRLPSVSAVESWVAGTPRGFLFAVKASRHLTHSCGSCRSSSIATTRPAARCAPRNDWHGYAVANARDLVAAVAGDVAADAR
jgi:uncharacterized protein YecE (DUF72 family)